MLGDRNGRWAMVVEKDGTISYSETETSPGQVTVSYQWQQIYGSTVTDIVPRSLVRKL